MPGLQYSSTDRLSTLSTPLRIRCTILYLKIPLIDGFKTDVLDLCITAWKWARKEGKNFATHRGKFLDFSCCDFLYDSEIFFAISVRGPICAYICYVY